MRNILQSACIAIFFSSTIQAAHHVGGSISWEPSGQPNSFIFRLELLQDCGWSNIWTNQDLDGPFGTISTTLDASQTEIMSLNACYTPSCPFGTSSGVRRLVYFSAPVTLSGVIPAAGWEFSWQECCLRAFDNTGSGSTNLYLSSIMYPDAKGNIPSISTFNTSTSAFFLNGFGTESVNLKAYANLGIDSVQSRLTTPLQAASTPMNWNTGYLNSRPLGIPMNLDSVSGIASIFVNSISHLNKDMIMGLEHSFYADGVVVSKQRKTIPVLVGTSTSSNLAPAVTVEGNGQFFNYIAGGPIPTFNAQIGDTTILYFKANDVGDGIRATVKSRLLNSARATGMGWSQYDTLKVEYLNFNGASLAADSNAVKLTIVPTRDNLKDNDAIINVQFEDQQCPNNPINFSVILHIDSAITINRTNASDTIVLCQPSVDSLLATNFTNGYWSPGNLVSDSLSARTLFTGLTPAWIKVIDSISGLSDSLYVRPIANTLNVQRTAQNAFSFSHNMNLSGYVWQLNGVPFLANTPTLNPSLSGVYNVLAVTLDGCYINSDTLIYNSGSNLVFSPPNSPVTNQSQALDSIRGVQFRVNTFAIGSAVNVNAFQLFGLSVDPGKRAAHQVNLKLYQQSSLIWQDTKTLVSGQRSLEFVPSSLQIFPGQGAYTLAVQADTGVYFTMFKDVNFPQTIGLYGALDLLEFVSGSDTSTAPITNSNKGIAMGGKFTFIASTSEWEANQLRLFPNPVKDELTIEVNNPRGGSFKLCDISGKVLNKLTLSSGKNAIDLSYLPAGTYIVKGTGVVQKFIKL